MKKQPSWMNSAPPAEALHPKQTTGPFHPIQGCHNFFCPCVKPLDKKRIGSKTIKRYDSPKTPCQRVIESPHASQKIKDGMARNLEKQNPFLSRKAIEAKLKKIFALSASGSHPL